MTRDEIVNKIHALRTEDDYIQTKALVALMDEAIAAERERCAKIARGTLSGDCDCGSCAECASISIAAQIRESEKR